MVESELKEACARFRPDAWVLTETQVALSPGTEYRCVSTSMNAPDRTPSERWVSIWVRDDLRAEEVPLRAEPERSACVRIRSREWELLLIGTVLPWRADVRRDPVRGGAAFVAALEWQMAEWDTLRIQHPKASICVTGDLNQELQGRIYVGSKEGWKALAAGLERRKLICVTGGESDPLYQRGWRSSIDHIIVSSDIRATDLEIWPSTPTLPSNMPDHYGVCASLSVA